MVATLCDNIIATSEALKRFLRVFVNMRHAAVRRTIRARISERTVGEAALGPSDACLVNPSPPNAHVAV